MKRKKIHILPLILIVVFIVLGVLWASKKLTYLEYTTENAQSDIWIELNANGDSFAQDFISPYEMLEGISVQIGTFARDNNSMWDFKLVESNSNKILYNDDFNASQIQDNGYYKIEFKHALRVNKGKKYSFVITAKDVSEISSLAFYASNESIIPEVLRQNGSEIDADLCFRIYGGDSDYWWFGLIGLLAVYLILIYLRAMSLIRNNKKISDDLLFQAMLIGGVVFVLRCSFAVGGGFTDEYDNMRGGMVIANGGILYKDYVTQHTPVAYYLCGIFALLGAGSVEQFRLSYYLVEGLVWALIYIRNADAFGRKKVMMLPVLEAITISTIISPQGYQILSDGIQGIAFVALLLEFLNYIKNQKLDWKRSIILSLCIWASFGSAFVSVYSLAAIFVIVCIFEVFYWQKEKIALKTVRSRYSPIMISVFVPFVAAAIYFKINHSLKRAFDQFYSFNVEVYPKYTGGFGTKVSQPFVNGVQNFFNIVANNFHSIISSEATNVAILQLFIVVAAIVILIKLLENKKYFECAGLFFVMIFAATRGYGFHGLAAWYVAIMIIALNTDMFSNMLPKTGKPVLVISSIILFSTYVGAVGNNMLYTQLSVSELESQVIALTDKDENKDIFLDAYCCDSLYFFYKDRKPVNAAVYMLPWYMDWYEKDDIYALADKNPKVVVYNEDRTCWDIGHYTVAFEKELKNYYTNLGDADSGWKHSVWIRNE